MCCGPRLPFPPARHPWRAGHAIRRTPPGPTDNHARVQALRIQGAKGITW